MDRNVFSVFQLNQYIKHIFENDYTLKSLWVQGEISNFKKHSSGHLYFTLKDSQSAISCVMFKMSANHLNFELENGMSVMIFGKISLYEKTGQYQLYSYEIEPFGKGAFYLAFEQLKQKLLKEGLFDNNHKKQIPKYPNTIAIITSKTGAAIKDIIQISKRRNPNIELIVVPVLVQGKEASNDIVKAIKIVNEWKKADVIILGRGGGSIEDLWAFNEEITVRAVYNSKIPIISAVGHEIDYTLTDFVADMRAPTPSAAAEIAVPNVNELNSVIHSKSIRMYNSIIKKIDISKLNVKNVNYNVMLKRLLEQIYQSQIYVEKLQKDMEKNISLKFNKLNTQIKNYVSNLETLSPLSVLERGYSIVYNEDGQLLKSIENIEDENTLKIQLQDGILTVKVKSKEKIYGKEKTTIL